MKQLIFFSLLSIFMITACSKDPQGPQYTKYRDFSSEQYTTQWGAFLYTKATKDRIAAKSETAATIEVYFTFVNPEVENIVSYGVCWSEAPGASLNGNVQNSHLIQQSVLDTGIYRFTVAKFKPDTEYFLRSFIITADAELTVKDTGYNEEIKFATTPLRDEWEQLKDFFSARYDAVSFSMDGKGYIATGNDNFQVYNDLWQYDPVLDSWTQKAPLPGGERYRAVGFVAGSFAYVGLGNNGQDDISDFQDFYRYDPSTNVWAQMDDFDGGARENCIAFGLGGDGYVGLGRFGPTSEAMSFFKYDVSNNRWIQLDDFAGGPRSHAVAFSVGDRAFVGLGLSTTASPGTTVYYNDFWEFNAASSTGGWSSRPSFGGEPRADAVGFGLLGDSEFTQSFYMGLGYDENGYFRDMWKFDPQLGDNGVWVEASPFPGEFRSGPSLFEINNFIYIGLGRDSDPVQKGNLSDLWKYYP